LASFLLQDSVQGKVDSLQAAVDAGLRICTFSVLLPTLEAHVPGIASQIEFLDTYEQGFADMGAKCDVQLVPPFAYDMAIGGVFTPSEPAAHCNKMLVGRPLASINCLALSSELYHMPLSYFVVKHRTSGLLDRIKERSEFQLPSSKCGSPKALETDQLYVSSMLGTIALSGALMLIGLLVRCCSAIGSFSCMGHASRALPCAGVHGEDEPKGSSTPLGSADVTRGRMDSFVSFAGSLASTAPSRGMADDLVSGRQVAGDLEVVRDAMAQVLTLLGSHQGTTLPPALLGRMAPDVADLKVRSGLLPSSSELSNSGGYGMSSCTAVPAQQPPSMV